LNDQKKYVGHNKIILQTIIFFIGVLGTLYIAKKINWTYKDTLPYIKGLGICVVLVVLFSFKSIQSYIQIIPGKIKFVYVGLFFVFCFAHLLQIPRASFPFIPWQMFSHPMYTSEVRFYEYIGYTRGGERIKLLPPVYFKSLTSSRIITDLDNLLHLIYYQNQEDKLYREERYEAIVKNSPLNGTGYKGAAKNFISRLRLSMADKPMYYHEDVRHILNQRLMAVVGRYNEINSSDPLIRMEVVEGLIDIKDRPEINAVRHVVWKLIL